MSLAGAQFHRLNLKTVSLDQVQPTERRLSDLKGYFVDEKAYQAVTQQDDSLVYQVSSVDQQNGEGDLHYGLGVILPGKVGEEYYFTKGHLHERREAAEVYVGLAGTGRMLLEEMNTGQSKMLPLEKDTVVYVPGYTAHRTINIGTEPLVYLGVYPADAGHEYGPIVERNFHHVVVETSRGPELIKREEYLRHCAEDKQH